MSQQLANRLRTLTNAAGKPMLKGVHVGYEVDKPELRLSIDRSRAAVARRECTRTSRAPCKFSFGGHRISAGSRSAARNSKVMVQLERASRLTPQQLDTVFVRGSKGELIQLSTVVKRETGRGPQRHQPLPASAQRQHHRVHRVGPHSVPVGQAAEAMLARIAGRLPLRLGR